MIYAGNEALLTSPNFTLNPNTGYRSFYSQEGYTAGNGRLIFSFNWNNGHRYGDTNVSGSTGGLMLEVDGNQTATDWLNSQIAGATTNANVISDYLVLTTTEGYQSAMYHAYLSETVPIANGAFSTSNKSLSGPTITFSKSPPFSTMWHSNGNSAANWSPTQ